MLKLTLAIIFFIATCAKAQEMPPNPIPATRKSLGMSFVDYINLERFRLGLQELEYSDQLTCAASLQAAYLAYHNLCIHYGPRFESFSDRAKRCGGAARGEVLACGHTDFVAVVDDWIADQRHRDIILDPDATQIGGASLGDKWIVLVNK